MVASLSSSPFHPWVMATWRRSVGRIVIGVSDPEQTRTSYHVSTYRSRRRLAVRRAWVWPNVQLTPGSPSIIASQWHTRPGHGLAPRLSGCRRLPLEDQVGRLRRGYPRGHFKRKDRGRGLSRTMSFSLGLANIPDKPPAGETLHWYFRRASNTTVLTL